MIEKGPKRMVGTAVDKKAKSQSMKVAEITSASQNGLEERGRTRLWKRTMIQHGLVIPGPSCHSRGSKKIREMRRRRAAATMTNFKSGDATEGEIETGTDQPKPKLIPNGWTRQDPRNSFKPKPIPRKNSSVGERG